MPPKLPQTTEMPPPGHWPEREALRVVKNIFKVTASQSTSLHFKCECVYAIRFQFQAFPANQRGRERESNSMMLQGGRSGSGGGGLAEKVGGGEGWVTRFAGKKKK